MKYLFVLFFIYSSISVAKVTSLANGQANLYNSVQSYEMTIGGQVAQKLYETLESTPLTVDSEDGGWINKVAKSIVCGQNLKTQEYFCSLNVDENGVQ